MQSAKVVNLEEAVTEEQDEGALQDKVEITLSRPLTVDGKQVRTLTMREPTLADQLAASKVKGDDGQKESQLFANLCGIGLPDLTALPMRDYSKLQKAYVRFLL